MHEQIENEFIIGQLQQRSRTVYNVHSDNKLSEMLSLFEKGLRSVKVSTVFLNSKHVACLQLFLFLLLNQVLSELPWQSHTLT